MVHNGSKYFTGTSGWNYKAWKTDFYKELIGENSPGTDGDDNRNGPPGKPEEKKED